MNKEYPNNIEETIWFTWTLDTSDTNIDDWMMSDSWWEEETSTVERQVHQSEMTTTESTGTQWITPVDEVDDTDTAAVLDSVWATKAAVVGWLWYYSQHATKSVVVDWMIEEVANDTARIDALKTLAKLHFDKQFRTVKRNKKLNVVLIRDGQ